jgi:hypothetical protein
MKCISARACGSQSGPLSRGAWASERKARAKPWPAAERRLTDGDFASANKAFQFFAGGGNKTRYCKVIALHAAAICMRPRARAPAFCRAAPAVGAKSRLQFRVIGRAAVAANAAKCLLHKARKRAVRAPATAPSKRN